MKPSLLETLLDPSQLSVCFQPIFHIHSRANQVYSLEALIRGPRGTNLHRADVLFDYVRRKKAEAAVDQSCFAAICHAATGLPSNLRINVNVHASTLGHGPGFVSYLRSQAKKHSLGLERLTVEIVEHSPTLNVLELLHSLASLREDGVRIALDDVGLGQSNYRMIVDCNPEYFKLDSYFVHGLRADSNRRAVVKSLIALAGAMGSSVVAEGVESKEDLSELVSMGVDLVQANLLCPAKPLEDLSAAGLLGAATTKPLSGVDQALNSWKEGAKSLPQQQGSTDVCRPTSSP